MAVPPQPLLNADSVEVVRASHRADIVGNNDIVVELQHSPISAEHIAARESFYGRMIWLFDATERFEMINTGRRTFFSLCRTKHIPLCSKPVFLDFGGMIVEVEAFTDSMCKLSGFGKTRTPRWFVENFLAQKLLTDTSSPSTRIQTIRWTHHHRFDRLQHPSQWNDPEADSPTIIQKDAVAIHCCWYTKIPGRTSVFEWERLLERHAAVANGWTKSELLAAEAFLNGKIMLIDGLLRVMPASPDDIQVNMPVAAASACLEKLEAHIAAGRIPILKDKTKAALVEKARKYEEVQWGVVRTPQKQDPQGSLFD
jgi:hypothetical protein